GEPPLASEPPQLRQLRRTSATSSETLRGVASQNWYYVNSAVQAAGDQPKAVGDRVWIHLRDSFTIYRRSRNPFPSKIAGIAFSIRAVRVPDCFAPVK